MNTIKILGAFLYISATAYAGPWFEKANFGGTARHRSSAFSIGNMGYVGLGHVNSGVDVEYEDFWRYDPASDTWTQIANYPEGRCYHAAAFVIGNKGYVGTGRLESGSYSKKFFCYDPVTNTWTQIADVLGVARRGAVGFSLNGKGYIGTGQTTSGFSKDFYEYDPGTNTWTAKALFPGAARTSAVGFTIEGSGYLGTGQTNAGSVNDFYQFNPQLNQWILKAPVGVITRQEAAGFSLNGLGYIGTGDDFSSGNNYSDFWEYDPVLNTWVQIEDFAGTARRYLATFVIGSRAYAGTGTSGTNFRDFWMFDQILSVLQRKSEEIKVKLYPNPAAEKIHLSLGDLPTFIHPSSINLSVYNSTGQVCKQLSFTSNSQVLDVQNLPDGWYIYRLEYDNQAFKTGKFIVRK
jgi:N-acetylneuraminic acid mutarotase